jgi:uncharacterized protein YbgA (DUF1722 family)
MLEPKSGKDLTQPMKAFSRKRVMDLGLLDLCGYILKKGSPSCGMERVKVYGKRNSPPRKAGVGFFAAELKKQLPLLPLEEEGRLHDPRLRENFIERVFAYRRWKDFLKKRFTRGRLVVFHTGHKYLLLARSPRHYRDLGRIVALAKDLGAEETKSRYGFLFMEGMAQRTTVRKHTNVLQHMAGFFRRNLPKESRRELGEVIEDYHGGLVPLNVPITLIRHHARRLPEEYLLQQLYLNPHPKELMLRNHV